jgi:hypothetical protein
MDDLRRIASKVNCKLHDFTSLVENMRDQGIIMKTTSGSYRVVT